MSYLESLATIYILFNVPYVLFAVWRDKRQLSYFSAIEDHRIARRKAENDLSEIRIQLLAKRHFQIDGKFFDLVARPEKEEVKP